MSSTNMQIIKNGVQVQGFESGGIVLDVQGTQGQLFSITDSLTGDIFKVSDISGIPILNINSSGAITLDGAPTITGLLTANAGMSMAGNYTFSGINQTTFLGTGGISLASGYGAFFYGTVGNVGTLGSGIKGDTDNTLKFYTNADGSNVAATLSTGKVFNAIGGLQVNGTNVVTNSGTWGISITGNAYTLSGTISIDKSSQDLNTVVSTGFFRGSAMTNAPDSGWWWVVDQSHDNVAAGSSGWNVQDAVAYGAGNTYTGGTHMYRVRPGSSVWGSWIKIWDTNNLTNLNQLTNGPGYTTNTGTVTSVAGTGTVSGLTLTGTVTTSGSLTLGGSITTPTSGNWHNSGFTKVGTDGVMEVGKYIDFHSANTGTSDYDVRLDCTGSNAATFGASTTVTAGTFNGALASSVMSLLSGSLTTTSSSTATLATFSASTYSSFKVFIEAKSGTTLHVTELTSTYNGTNVYFTQYGTVQSGASLATFTVTASAGNLLLQVIPASATSTTFKYIANLIKI